MMVWQVQRWNEDTSEWEDIDFADIQITKSLNELNTTTLQTTTELSLDDLIRILYDGNEVFKGHVTRVRRSEGGIHEITITEMAIELRKQLVDYGGQYRHEWYSLTVDEIIDRILSGSGWTRESSDTTTIPAISLEYVDRLTALSKIIKEMRGKYLWFTSDRKVVFGDYNVDRTAEDPFRYDTISFEEDNDETYDKIIVLGRGDGINQEKVEIGSGTRVKVYMYKDAKSTDELQKIAEVLYASATQTKRSMTVTGHLRPEISEGDLITVDGETWLVVRAEHSTASTQLELGNPQPTLSQLINEKLRGIEEIGHVAQGATNVANFGGWETAVDADHSATYRFFLPDSSVGTIRVNEAFINVYGKAYRIWHKGAAAGSTGENAEPTTSVSESGMLILDSADKFGTWVDVVTITPSDFSYDVNHIFGEITIDTYDGNYGESTWFYVRLFDKTDGVELDKVYKLLPHAEDENNDYVNGTVAAATVFWSGKRPKDHTYALQIYLDSSYDTGDRFNVKGHMRIVSGHDHGTHVHPIETGIFETDDYPSNVRVYVNGQLVADQNSHPDLAGGQEFSVTKIDIKPHVNPGENTIEVKSDTLGMIQVDGFYRIFVETSR